MLTMKASKKCSTITSYIVTCFLLGGFVCSGEAQVIISKPPQNITICRGSDVTISCGYNSATRLYVTWIINGASFDQSAIVNSPLYQLNNPTTPMRISLTMFSINDTTTVQCIVHSTSNTTSTLGKISLTERPVIKITTATGGCGYVYVSWSVTDSDLDDMCTIGPINVKLSSEDMFVLATTNTNSHNFTGLPDNTLFNVTVLGISLTGTSVVNLASSSVRTMIIKRPAHIMVTPNVSFIGIKFAITVSWQAPQFTNCAANIIMYKITVMDQYSPASVTVAANMSSVEISQFPDNGTSIVANREYTITVLAISDQGTRYPSDPVTINTFILQNCTVTSPTTGIITVSCDSSHQILVTVTCTNCNNPNMVTSSGSSPLTVSGLDPGMMYSVKINMFDGNQVVLKGIAVTRTITVMSTTSTTTTAMVSIIATTTAMESITATSTAIESTIESTVESTTAASVSTASVSTTTATATTTTKTTKVTIPTTTELSSGSDSGSDSESGGSNAGAIAGGVIGGIVVVIIIVIIIIVIYYLVVYKDKDKGSTSDDQMKLKSPPATGETHASEGEEETDATTATNTVYDKVLYAAPAQTVNVPHQTSAAGELYAVSTKAVNKKNQDQPSQEHVNKVDTKTDFQGVTYADLQELPVAGSEQKTADTPHPAAAYAELLL